MVLDYVAITESEAAATALDLRFPSTPMLLPHNKTLHIGLISGVVPRRLFE